MKLSNSGAEVFVPDRTPEAEALTRTTHLGLSAHQDDLEIMCAQGILGALGRPGVWFGGVVVTNGSGSPRDGLYKDYTDDEMQIVRRKEQRKAAVVGEYSFQAQLDYPSSAVKDPADEHVLADLKALLEATRPQVVYTHNLADKHDTHVAVALRVIRALRELPAGRRPQKLYGGEVWRDLDWMCDEDKAPMDVSAHENLQAALLGVYDSQIVGGKRYDLATMGRRKANATYFASHGLDETSGLNYAMDMTPLIENERMTPQELFEQLVGNFREEVVSRLGQLA